MADEERPKPETDTSGPKGSLFILVGRVKHWEPIARQLTIGGRVLQVADSVRFVGDVVAGVSIMASGYQPSSNPTGQWIVTHLRVD